MPTDYTRDRRVNGEGIPITPTQACFDEDQLIERLFALDAAYQDNLRYGYYPFDGGYNSNSYTHGLMNAAGLNAPDFGGAWPGWSAPLPGGAFGFVPSPSVGQ